MPSRKELQVPISDVVHLLAGRKRRKPKKKAARRKPAPQVAAPPYVNPSQRYTGMSGFSMVNPAMFPYVNPFQQQARGQTININTNYDPDRHRVEVVTDSKSGVFQTEINPNDIAPRISQRRLIAGPVQQSLITSSLPPVSSRLEFSNPVAHLRQAPSIEVVPTGIYDPLKPGGRSLPPPLVSAEEEMLQMDAMVPPIDPGRLETEAQFEEYYAPAPKRLSKLTRKNPVTGELEQYQKGGRVMANYPINLGGLARGGMMTKPFLDDDYRIVPPGNPAEHFRGMPKDLRRMYGFEE